MEKSSRKTDRPDKAMTESELAAAQQLMQLSDEDNNNNSSSSSSSSSNKNTKHEGEEVDQSPLINVITWAKIEEIFGKEEDVDRPKKRRYRSLASIYLTSKPVNAGSAHGKKKKSNVPEGRCSNLCMVCLVEILRLSSNLVHDMFSKPTPMYSPDVP
ncbi:PREDICTED: CICLE_v10027329mg [Prunus dulcis]|uniref:PREDICTED: CICLE_v10027329mg n=2 Tax=Prunus dulcis TaxID=3755 RepID=A0A5E4GKL0_PRUDU|nr:hypothetical protein L3X38_032800 [Prunus dulcis]VVA40270.1 PREDICTED: CICLE_v10027329mg [Prunus dulcis]